MVDTEKPNDDPKLQASGKISDVKSDIPNQFPPDVVDKRLLARVKMADRYLGDHLADQRGWYSSKASHQKKWSQRIGLAIICCGALVTFAQVFSSRAPLLVPVVTGMLGVAIAGLTGMQRIWKYDESWIAYRRASEQMKREYRLYINDSATYAEIQDENEAYRHFVVNTEAVIAEEQQIYWRNQAEIDRQGEKKELGDLA